MRLRNRLDAQGLAFLVLACVALIQQCSVGSSGGSGFFVLGLGLNSLDDSIISTTTTTTSTTTTTAAASVFDLHPRQSSSSTADSHQLLFKNEFHDVKVLTKTSAGSRSRTG